MSGYVVDASVAVKWLVAESLSDEAAMLLEKELTLIAPELLFAEATNALWAMRRRGDISDEDLAEGGNLELVVRFPEQDPIHLSGLGTVLESGREQGINFAASHSRHRKRQRP